MRMSSDHTTLIHDGTVFQKGETMKRITTTLCFAAALAFSGAAFAQGAPTYGNSTGQGNSTPGGARYQTTAQNPNPNAQCGTGAGSGAFGYLGKWINLGIFGIYGSSTGVPGADGYQTGLNNSGVCGNRH